MKEYGKDEIFQKNLMLFLPFYVMRYEEAIKKNREAELANMLTEIDQILSMLDQCRIRAAKKGIYITVNELFRKVNHYMANNNHECRERMDKVMGGHVLELESVKILRQGREEGRKEGKEEGIKEGKKEGRKEGLE